jgi:hypothetical protein
MEFDWTHAGFEADARRELGAELAEIIDHFPRVVHALFAQMQNARDTGGTFPRSEFVRQVLAELPKSCDEVLPFFARSIWNKKWTPTSHAREIEELAGAFVRIVRLAGGELSEAELLSACNGSFESLG